MGNYGAIRKQALTLTYLVSAFCCPYQERLALCDAIHWCCSAIELNELGAAHAALNSKPDTDSYELF